MKHGMLFVITLILAALFWMPACQSPDDTGTLDQDLLTREQTIDLDDPYGGFNLADEPAAFDDPVLLSEFSGAEDVAYEDPLEVQARISEAERMRINRFFVRVTWGNLERDSTIAFVTDWSGSLTVDSGFVLLKRVIEFEPEDNIVPRVSPDLLEWVSHTGLSFDGIIVKILPAPAPSLTSLCNDTNTVVHFDFGPFTRSYDLAELRDIHEVIPVDDAGNAVSIDAIRIDPTSCPQGFLRGVWKDVPERPGGVFFGKWETESGMIMGHLRGVYGVNSKGDHVMFGKYIDCSGRFRGMIRGRYWHGEEEGQGGFAAVWMDRNMLFLGELKGGWKTGESQYGDGFFRGQWRMRCREGM
ncbi:MAG: hypothetical protein HY770_05840 [Chitinivibrionia bacterium]|nr:hypothetical protein [Chitinivibrionia bacterium]